MSDEELYGTKGKPFTERVLSGGVADSLCDGASNRPAEGGGSEATIDRSDRRISGQRLRLGVKGELGGLADADGGHTRAERQQRSGKQRQQPQDGGLRDLERHLADGAGTGIDDRLRDVALWPGPTNGLWRDADWIFCRDGKWRPVEPGTFPLAHGAPARVGRLRGYGNAINAEAAVAFIEAAMAHEIIDMSAA
jgi:hypothetical protein